MIEATPFPHRDQASRMEALRAVLRPLDTWGTSVQELVAACLAAVPDAPIEEISAAIKQVSAEHSAQAEGLRPELQRRQESEPE